MRSPPGVSSTRAKRERASSRSPSLALTREESQHLRAALFNLRRAYGSWSCLADAMGVLPATVHHATLRGKRSSAAVALRAAKAGGMSVETILGGKLTTAGKCTACGSRLGGGAS